MMLKILINIALISFLLISCNPKKEIIPEKKMVPILVKIHILDASINGTESRVKYLNRDTIDYTSKIVENYGYTKAQFDSSLKYYSNNPKILDNIYDKVINELSDIETKLIQEEAKADSIAKADTVVNLWNLKQKWELPADGAMNSIDFDILTQGLGTYTISADVKVYQDDQSVNPKMTANFYVNDQLPEENNVSCNSELFLKDGKIHRYSITMNLRNKLVTNIKGSILSHQDMMANFRKHAEVSNIKITFRPTLEVRKRLPIREKLKVSTNS